MTNNVAHEVDRREFWQFRDGASQWIPSFDEFDSSHQSFTVPVFTFITRSRFVILWQTFDRSCDINLCHMTHHVIDLDLVVDRTSSLI